MPARHAFGASALRTARRATDHHDSTVGAVAHFATFLQYERRYRAVAGVFAVKEFGVSGIAKTEGVCGGSARIVRTRIPVWALEQYRRLGMTETAILQAFPTLQVSDLSNAWYYAQTQSAEIDDEIRRNESDNEA